MPVDEYDECPQIGQVFGFARKNNGNGFFSLMNDINRQVQQFSDFSL